MSADRNLLFGMLALHNGFVTREQLLEAMNAWMLRKQTPLGDLLRDQGILPDDDLRLLDGLVDRHVVKHGDVPKSLAALPVAPEVSRGLSQLADADVQASVKSAWPETVAPAATGNPVPVSAGGWMRYRMLRPHAKGGFGEVSVARD